MKYAVYTVIVEDTVEADYDLSTSVDAVMRGAGNLTFDEAIEAQEAGFYASRDFDRGYYVGDDEDEDEQ